jgi:AraC-like DNA-binding protein
MSAPFVTAGDTVSARVLIELVRAVERAGVARDAFMRAAQLEPEQLHGDDVRVSLREIHASCAAALELTGDPALGLHWGEWLTSNAFNLMSHLLAHSASLRQALASMQRFQHLVSDQMGVDLIEQGDVAELRSIDAPDQPLPVRRLRAEMVMLGLLRLVRDFAGPSAKIVSVRFPYPAPDYRAEYTRLFAGAERFEQPTIALAFDRTLLRARSPQMDEDLYGTLSDLAERRLLRLHSRAPYAVRVRHYLMQQPAPQRVTMPQVARGLGVSVRSLHRRLSEEGRSYVSLVAEACGDLAKRLLSDERHTIQGVAHAMGFANVSSFHRAFRRWTGSTPAALRRQRPASRSRRAG